MSLLLGPMCQHIPGKKSLTDHSEPIKMLPKEFAYIPLQTGNNANYEVLVQEGDHVDVGTLLAKPKTGFMVPIYSSVSGTYEGTEKRAHNSLKPAMHARIKLDHKQTSVQAFKPLDWQKATREEMVDFVMNSGIIGQGGAGFPTYIKYSKPEGIDCVIINLVECEPYITADYRASMDDPKDLVEGCLICAKMAKTNTVYIGIKKTHPDLIKVVNDAINEMNASATVSVKEVPDVYPMGWERVLVREILHKEYETLPAQAGAIVNNATTAIALTKAFRDGTALGEKMVTFSGECLKQDSNVIVPVGMAVNEIIDNLGGFTKEDSVYLIAGGPMMGKTMVKSDFVIDRASNAITVLKPLGTDEVACLRCGSCSDHCPAGLQPVRIANAVAEGNVEEMEKRGALSCIECGLCSYVCPSKLPVTENVRKAKRTLMLKKKK